MTRISDLEDSLQELQEIYEQQLDEDLNQITLENKRLKDCLTNQVSLQISWEEIQKSCQLLYDSVHDEYERVYSLAFKDLMMDSYKDLTTTEAKVFANSDNDVVDVKRLLLRVKDLKGKIEAISNSVSSRKYTLKSLSDLVVNSVDDYII